MNDRISSQLKSAWAELLMAFGLDYEKAIGPGMREAYNMASARLANEFKSRAKSPNAHKNFPTWSDRVSLFATVFQSKADFGPNTAAMYPISPTMPIVDVYSFDGLNDSGTNISPALFRKIQQIVCKDNDQSADSPEMADIDMKGQFEFFLSDSTDTTKILSAVPEVVVPYSGKTHEIRLPDSFECRLVKYEIDSDGNMTAVRVMPESCIVKPSRTVIDISLSQSESRMNDISFLMSFYTGIFAIDVDENGVDTGETNTGYLACAGSMRLIDWIDSRSK